MSVTKSAIRRTEPGVRLGKRVFDVLCVLIVLPVALPVMFLIAIAIKLTSQGPVLHWSKRVGRHSSIFLMPKFRTMRTDTPQLATHLMSSPEKFLTPIGGFLRRKSLDELPQLW